jgi:hypothetical protein
MDLEDFKYNYKYKIIIPAIYIISWVAMFLGPFTFQVLYQKICICLLIYLSFKSLIILLISVITYTKANHILNRAEKMKKDRELHNDIEPPHLPS